MQDEAVSRSHLGASWSWCEPRALYWPFDEQQTRLWAYGLAVVARPLVVVVRSYMISRGPGL